MACNHYDKDLVERARKKMKPDVQFTRHARNRMRWRQVQLSREQVGEIIENPDSETSTVENRTNSWRRRDEGWIRVTWIIENGVTIVVSVNRDKNGPPS